MTALPDLIVFEAPDHLEATDQLRLQTVWRNEGAAGTGLRILIWGPALDLVEIDGVHIGMPRVAHPVVSTDTDDGRAYVCELPEHVIPPGLELASERVSTDQLERTGASMIVVEVRGTVSRSGNAALHVSLAPLDAEDAELLTVELALRRS